METFWTFLLHLIIYIYVYDMFVHVYEYNAFAYVNVLVHVWYMYSIILIVYVYNVLYLYYMSYVPIACMFLPIKKKIRSVAATLRHSWVNLQRRHCIQSLWDINGAINGLSMINSDFVYGNVWFIQFILIYIDTIPMESDLMYPHQVSL